MSGQPRHSKIIEGYCGGAMAADVGELIRITDIEGSQIGDFFAIARSDHYEYLSPSNTRAINWSLFPKLREPFYSTRARPILTYQADDSPGIHDMFFSPCDLDVFTRLGVEGYHPNCHDNYLAAARDIGISHEIVPDPVNVFQNTPSTGDGTILPEPVPTKAGDSVTFRAELDVFVVLAACSVDQGFDGITGPASTALKMEIFTV